MMNSLFLFNDVANEKNNSTICNTTYNYIHFLFTKWWLVLPPDGPDILFSGFPLPFVCDGLHTSLSLDFFVFEFIIDFLTYFLIWLLIFISIKRFIKQIRIQKIIATILWSLSAIVISLFVFVMSFSDNLFFVKRDFDIQTIKSGYKFIWQQDDLIERDKYHNVK